MTLAVTLTVDELRALVRDEVRAAMPQFEPVPPLAEQFGASDPTRPIVTARGYLHTDCTPSGWVYLIGTYVREPVKIGWSERPPESRLFELQPGNPQQLRLLLSIPACPPDERRLHARFAAHRIRGEWFEWCDDLHFLYTSLAPKDAPERESLAAEIQAGRSG